MLLARIKVSPDDSITLAILVAIILGIVLFVLLLQKLGKKGSAIVLGVLFLAIGYWLINGSRLSAHHDRLAEIDTARAARLQASLVNVPPIPLATACANAGPWDLKRFAVTYAVNTGGEISVRVVHFSHSGEGLYGSDDEAYLWKGGGMFREALELGPPGNWDKELQSHARYPLSSVDVAVFGEGTSAAVVELETGKVLCAGTLSAGFYPTGYGGFTDNVKTFFIVLRPLCARLGAETCGRMDRKPF